MFSKYTVCLIVDELHDLIIVHESFLAKWLTEGFNKKLHGSYMFCSCHLQMISFKRLGMSVSVCCPTLCGMFHTEGIAIQCQLTCGQTGTEMTPADCSA